MSGFVVNILLAMAWALISDDFGTTNVVVGFVLGYLILRILKPALPITGRYVDKFSVFVRFLGYFTWELLRANMRMVYHVLTPHTSMSPGVVAVPLVAMSDVEATLLANLITLTPGTLSVDVQDRHDDAVDVEHPGRAELLEPDGRPRYRPRTLYVHVVDCEDPDAVRAELKNGFERRLLEVTR